MTTADTPQPSPPLSASPQDIEALIALFNQGRYTEVEPLAQAMTERFPLHSFAWKVLGALYRQAGRREDALAMMQKAAVLSPDDAEAYNNLSVLLRELGQLKEAQVSCLRALAIKPDYAEAHNNLGIVFQALGELSDAQTSYQKALAFKPDYAEAYNNLGVLQKALGHFEDAQASCRRAVEIRPNYAEAYNNLGIALQALGRIAEAQACYLRTLEIKPSYAEAHNNLGTVFKALGRFDDAQASYQKALAIKPDYAEALGNLGMLFNEAGRFADAQRSYQRALAITPDDAKLHSSLGYVLKELGYLAQAEASCRQALAIAPDDAGAYSNLGIILVEQGRLAEAEASYERALAIEPDNPMFHSNLLCALNFTGDRARSSCLEAARRFGRQFSKPVGARFETWPCEATPVERLRVGLVSADLRHHPVGYFLESLLPYIDQTRVELIAYPSSRNDDELTTRIKPYFTAWQATEALSDKALASRIHADGTHILLDLAGHTARNRLPVFLWKPAPIQISWLGYFATTGMAEMDYLLADAVGVPVEHRDEFTEQIAYLPDTRLCFTAPRDAPEISPLPALSNPYITFASFQNLAKITDSVLALWSRVLAAVPKSRLRLQNKALEDSVIRAAFDQRLRQHRIDPASVDLQGYVPRVDYLTAHGAVDFILDTFPYPGGTTTCEALWMGVPTLTLSGQTLLARQGASLLTAAGLSGWVAADEDEFVRKAQAFAADLPHLAALRAGLREQLGQTALFDAERFSRNFESTLWALWRARAEALDI